MENEILRQILDEVKGISEKVSSLDSKVSSLDNRVSSLEKDMYALREDVDFVKNTVTHIEFDHGQKLGAIFDGYTANYELIERQDPRVTKLERAVEKLTFKVDYYGIQNKFNDKTREQKPATSV